MIGDTARRNVRRRALPRFIVWGLVGLAVPVFLHWLSEHFKVRVFFDVIAAATPGAMALVNLVELTTGLRFGEWEERWATLSGFKKSLFALAAVGAALLVGVLVVITLAVTGLL